MNVPNEIIVQVVSPRELDLSGLIVELTVTTGRKNPYHILFPQTDCSGIIRLTREDFVGQFTDHWEAALMDHSGTPETADPRVEVSLFDPSWSIANPQLALAWPLFKHERTKWSSRETEYQSRISSRNNEFVAVPIEVDLHKTQRIVFPVNRKSMAGSVG